ncbi:MAG TPA: ROK family transcriptional regulator [Actinopolymorphaceae bacterium]
MTLRPGSQASLRAANIRRVLNALRAHGVLSQAEIARLTGLSPASVSNIVHELDEAGTVEVRTGVRGGRRAREVRMAGNDALVVGVDFGHRHIRVAVADPHFTVRSGRRHECDVGASALAACAAAEKLLAELLGEMGEERSKIKAVGVGLPAPLPPTGGPVGSWPILRGWGSVDPVRELSNRFHAPVFVDNDANLGARGELHFGAGRGASSLAYIKAATGLGAGLVIDGRVYRGFSGSAGEIGHLTIDETGPVCSCGNRGCLETLVGAPYLLELVRHSHPDVRSLEALVSRAVEGDAGCRRVVSDAARHVGFVAANLCNVVNPERVVVGGELAAAGEVFLEPLRSAMSRYAVCSAAATPVMAAESGQRAEVLGALVLAAEQLELAAERPSRDSPARPSVESDASDPTIAQDRRLHSGGRDGE